MALSSLKNTTVAFDNKDRFWKTRYSFVSSCYGWLNNLLTSFKRASSVDDDIVHAHNATTSYNAFHGGQPDSSGIQVSFNDAVSSNKIYKSLSVEGTQNIENSVTLFSVNSDNTPNKSFSVGLVKDKGGILYADIGQMSNMSSANVKCIGIITDVRPINPNSSIPPEGYLTENYEHPLTNTVSSNDPDAYGADRYWAVRVSGGDLTAASKPDWRFQPGGELKYHGGLYFVKEVGSGDYVGDYGFMTQSLLTGIYSTLRDKSDLNDVKFAADMADPGRPSAPNSYDIPNHYAGEKILYTRTNFTVTENQSFVETYFAPDGSGGFNYQTKRYALYQVSESAIFGDEPRGQYCDLTIAFGSEKFEMYALNLNYETTNFDHGK